MQVTISRSVNATYTFSSLFLSRKHSSLKFDGHNWTLIDHGVSTFLIFLTSYVKVITVENNLFGILCNRNIQTMGLF